MPTCIFLAVSTLGRIPGTWVLSAEGSRTATGQYVELALLTALTAAAAIPLHYHRHAILARVHTSPRGPGEDSPRPPSAPGEAARPSGATSSGRGPVGRT